MIRPTLFSKYSVLTALVCFSAFAFACILAARRAGWRSLRVWAFGILLALLRFLIPIEHPFMKVISMGEFLSTLDRWLTIPLFGSLAAIHLLLGVWVAGVCIRLVWLGFRLHKQRRFICATLSRKDTEFYGFCQSVAREVGCPANGTVGISSGLSTAMMAGFFRPHLLLPECEATLPRKQLRLILLHEFTHFQSRDLWIKLGMELLCCLLWWNPLVYSLRSCVGQLLELRCDRRVCARLSEAQKIAYAETILSALQASLNKPVCFAASFIHPSKDRIKQRFRQITSPDKKTGKQRASNLLIVVLLLSLFIGSYGVVFAPCGLPEPLDPSWEFGYDLDSSFILRYPDGRLEICIDNRAMGTIHAEQLSEEPFCFLQIYDVHIAYE